MNMKVHFINVGYGEAILLEYSDPAAPDNNRTILIDGGSAEPEEYAGNPFRIPAAEYLKKRGVTRLDVVINTHIHEDHTGSLAEITGTFPVGEFWSCLRIDAGEKELPGELAFSNSSQKFISALNASRRISGNLNNRKIPARNLCLGERVPNIIPGLEIEVLGPPPQDISDFSKLLPELYAAKTVEESRDLITRLDRDMNNHSIILALQFQGKRILLVGDTNRDGYGRLLDGDSRRALRADVFKLGHHGQMDSVSPEILSAVDPAIAVVCASSDRRYNSSNPDLLSIVRKYGDNRSRPVDILFSDVPELPPFSDGVPGHYAAVIEIKDGTLRWYYET